MTAPTPREQRRTTLLQIATRYCPDVSDLYTSLTNELNAAMNELQWATLDEAHGKHQPGCVCKWPPETAKRHAAHTNTPFVEWQGTMALDHRCEFHGEKAQPKLWGRIKNMVLQVTPREWNALGREDVNPDTREGKLEALVRRLKTDAEYALNPQSQDRNMPIGLDLRSLVHLATEALK